MIDMHKLYLGKERQLPVLENWLIDLLRKLETWELFQPLLMNKTKPEFVLNWINNIALMVNGNSCRHMVPYTR